MRRICKSHWVITSQITGVKLWWENTTPVFLQATWKGFHYKNVKRWWTRKPLRISARKMGPAENVKNCWMVPFVGLVNTKNILRVQPSSISITAEDIFEKILYCWWQRGASQDRGHKDKHYVKALALHVKICWGQCQGAAMFCRRFFQLLHLHLITRWKVLHVWFGDTGRDGKDPLRETHSV